MAIDYDFTGTLPSGVTVAGAYGSTITVDGTGVHVTGAADNPPAVAITDTRSIANGGVNSQQAENVWVVLEATAATGTTAMGVYCNGGAEYRTFVTGDGQSRKYCWSLGDVYWIPRTEVQTQVPTDPIYAAVSSGQMSSYGKIALMASRIKAKSFSRTCTWSSGATTVTLTGTGTTPAAGQELTASGIPSGAVVTSVSGTTVRISKNTTGSGSSTSVNFQGNSLGIATTFTRTCDWSSGATAVTLSGSGTTPAAGQPIVATGIPDGTTVTSVSGTTVNLSAATTAAGSAATVTFFTDGMGARIIVFLSEVFGATGTLKRLQVATTPNAPAHVIVTRCRAAQADITLGVPSRMMARIINVGGRSASRISLSWDGAGGTLPIVPGSITGIPRRLRPGEDRTILFDVLPTGGSDAYRTGTVTVSTLQEPSGASKSARIWVRAVPTGLTPGTLPASSPPDTGHVHVSAFWFGPWTDGATAGVIGGVSYHVPSIMRGLERRPFYGYGDTADPKVIDAQILAMRNAGIQSIAVEWFPKTGIQYALLDGGLPGATKKDEIKFFVCYVTSSTGTSLKVGAAETGVVVLQGAGAPASGAGADNNFHFDTTNYRLYGPRTAGDWDTANYVTLPSGSDVTDAYYSANWLDHMRKVIPYFARSNYRFVNGKPFYSILNVTGNSAFYNQVVNSVGSSISYTTANDTWVSTLLARAQRMAQVAGYTGISYEGGGVNAQAAKFVAMGFVRVCSYGWFQIGSPFKVMRPAQGLAYGASTLWPQMNKATSGLYGAYIAVPFFCSSIWVDCDAPDWEIVECEPEDWGDHYQAAFEYARDEPNTPDAHREVRVIWNELGEGENVCPIAEYQDRLCAEMRSRADPSAAPVTLVTPADCGITITPMAGIRWAQMPTAFPSVDGTTDITEQGVTIVHSQYQTYEPAPVRASMTQTSAS